MIAVLFLVSAVSAFATNGEFSPWALSTFSDSSSIANTRAVVQHQSMELFRDQEILSFAGTCVWTYTMDLQVSDNYLYALNANGLEVYSISDIQNPTLVKQLPLVYGHIENRSALHGDILYVGRSHRVVLIDVSEPTDPVVLSEVALDGVVYEIQAADGRAYVGIARYRADTTSYTPGLYILDTENAAAPTILGKYEPPFPHSECRAFAIRNGYLYGINSWDGKLDVIDISDESNPSLVTSLDVDYPSDIEIDSTYLIVSPYSPYLRIYDISDSGAPVVHDSIEVGYFYGMKIYDERLYVIKPSNWGIVAYDIVEPGVLDSATSYPLRSAYHTLEFGGDFIFVPQTYYGFEIARTSYYGDIVAVTTCDHPVVELRGLASSGDYAYMTNHVSTADSLMTGVYTVDATDKEHPVLVDRDITRGNPDHAYVHNNLLFMSGSLSTTIYSIANPADPDSLSCFPAWNYQTKGAAVQGNTLYVVGGWAGFRTADISNPYSPVPLSENEPQDNLYKGPFINGDYAYTVTYLSADYGWLSVFDVSDPANLILTDSLPIGTSRTSYWPLGFMKKEGSILYHAAGNFGMLIWDISNPARPDLMERYQPDDMAVFDVEIVRNYLFISGASSIYVFDISDPLDRKIVQYFPLATETLRLDVQGENMYVLSKWGFYTLNMDILPSDCGDVDGSGGVDIDDIVYLISYVFQGGEQPYPVESGDVDCSGGVDIDDIVYLIAYVFQGGSEPCAGC